MAMIYPTLTYCHGLLEYTGPPTMRDDFKLSDFRRTRARIQPYIRPTPVVESETDGLLLKLENLQHTHSFKVRGAFSRMLELAEAGDSRTVLTVSAGNHGQAVARAASLLGLDCTIVVPEAAPKTKIEAIRSYGVDLRVEGVNYDAAEQHGLRLAGDSAKYVWVSAYNDPAVILGQGTIALELIEQVPDITCVLIPVGGGGLAAGIGAAMKQLRPQVRIVGVQAEASAAIYHSLAAGRLVEIPDRPTIADGIQGNVEPGSITFELIREFVDEVVTVPEDAIGEAIRTLLRREKILVEGAAAVTFAAYRAGHGQDGPTAGVISGGNVDLEQVLA